MSSAAAPADCFARLDAELASCRDALRAWLLPLCADAAEADRLARSELVAWTALASGALTVPDGGSKPDIDGADGGLLLLSAHGANVHQACGLAHPRVLDADCEAAERAERAERAPAGNSGGTGGV